MRSETRIASAVLRFPLGLCIRLGDLIVQFGYSHSNAQARPIKAHEEYRPDIQCGNARYGSLLQTSLPGFAHACSFIRQPG
ncbi:hypothetical protein XACW160_510130 [Xanthomonas citri pv. citri]|nr:hypothetical protein XAC902_690130 [Xanthomonas citri pv. citri]CEE65455.1 hypothetical protein XAC71A_740130 [Xanthomonas citri pv. citri]CEE65550.1 hypothetical protein XACLE20_1130129 [Xanthomonas citri pv. citri]CEE70034.1 hypothetical protein XACW160_510130 [Xanthomonas citri pv. citri]CEE75437.1 hypothetical protein XACS584_970130 [Xanthomonas citri pv. citri]